MTVNILNLTPFANMRYSSALADGREFGIFMLKAAFDVNDDGRCSPSEEQEPINFTDRYHGELNTSSLSHPSEFVPFKPGTDIVVNANAYAPGGSAVPRFHAGIKVSNGGRVISKRLNIIGPRYWEPIWKRQLNDRERANWRQHRRLFRGWRLSEPTPIESLPLRYEYAYGGTINRGFDQDGKPILVAYEYNPIGRGMIDPEWTDHTINQLAPQIEHIDDEICRPSKIYRPAGFGPIPPAWLPRRPLGGTYDQNWIETVWPAWPQDYQFEYHQSASEGLSIVPRIKGDFEITLENMHKQESIISIKYEDIVPYANIMTSEGEWYSTRFQLDTVHILEDIDQIFLIWRILFNINTTRVIQIWLGDVRYADSRERLYRLLRDNVHPDDVAEYRRHSDESTEEV